MFLKQPLLLFKTYVFFISIFHVLLYKGNSFDFNFIFNIYRSSSYIPFSQRYIPIYNAEMAYMQLKKICWKVTKYTSCFIKLKAPIKFFQPRSKLSNFKLFSIKCSKFTFSNYWLDKILKMQEQDNQKQFLRVVSTTASSALYKLHLQCIVQQTCNALMSTSRHIACW